MPELSRPRLRPALEGPFAEDWARQLATANEILGRLEGQEGVILADQVGMGKTFTALAVALKEIVGTPSLGQVVVFVPAKVATKWHNEWNKFREMLVLDGDGIRCPPPLRRGEDFLKALDDPPDRRGHILIVTHEALTQSLNDRFIQLALMYYAVRNRTGAADIRQLIARWSTGSAGLLRDVSMKPEYVRALLEAPPADWRDVWRSSTGEDLGDDPVPAQLDDVSSQLDLDDLFHVLRSLPKYKSANIRGRLKVARTSLSDATQSVWKQVLVNTQLRLPLIIVDEAHALKNDRTRVSRLFTPLQGQTEVGALKEIFDRMLFLTATPFELGHSELIRVLSRFGAVNPSGGLPAEPLKDRLARLAERLRMAQETAITLDASWTRLSLEDAEAFSAWSATDEPPIGASTAVGRAWRDAQNAAQAREHMHEALRPWIIRHQRPGRRSYLPGSAIDPASDSQTTQGLVVPDSAALAFLLAARAQSVASQARSGSGRPLFAYGIASSYETFLRLEEGSEIPLDSDEPAESDPDDSESPSKDGGSEPGIQQADWYRNEIGRLLASDEVRDDHPKVRATAARALELWAQGEKCLIFCWYIRTTQRLTETILKEVDRYVVHQASSRLDVPESDVGRRLDQLSDHLLKGESRNFHRIREHVLDALSEAPHLDEQTRDQVAQVAIRHLRTADYLVRYSHMSPGMGPDDVIRGIQGDNPVGVDIGRRWITFAQRLQEMVPAERERTMASLLGEQRDDGDSGGPRARGASLASVRRAYGQTDREDRERLITVFNTPFAPDILVASSVMGEGIDLHHECRHVIHHDLDWNPSRLEQRTGRLDRIGALAEREGQPIVVYEPYLSGTHDEKMFLVVKDRAGWFDIVMGQSHSTTEEETDSLEKRVPLAPAIAAALTMDLSVVPPSSATLSRD